MVRSIVGCKPPNTISYRRFKREDVKGLTKWSIYCCVDCHPRTTVSYQLTTTRGGRLGRLGRLGRWDVWDVWEYPGLYPGLGRLGRLGRLGNI